MASTSMSMSMQGSLLAGVSMGLPNEHSSSVSCSTGHASLEAATPTLRAQPFRASLCTPQCILICW